MRKGRKRQIDARSLVKALSVVGDGGLVEMQLLTETSKAALKPLEIIAALFGLSDKEIPRARVMKMWCREG